MYEQIFGRSNLAVLNRALANAQLDIQLDDITIHIIWLSYSHFVRPPEKPEVIRTAPHRHSFFEMHLFLRGSAVYQAREAEHTVQEGELLFLGKEVPHLFAGGTQSWDKISLAFDITSRSSPTVARVLKVLSYSDVLVTRFDPAILTSFNDILNEADAQEP
ncbi:MAG: AraC family ligand binding domain-containing protein, partial [Aristaeellaceae bacterium]